MKEKLYSIIQEIANKMNLDSEGFVIEYPADMKFGDYATNIAMVAGKSAGKNPRQLAEEIKEKILAKNISEIEAVEIAGPGFINISLSLMYFNEVLKEVLQNPNNFGKNNIGNNKKVVVEYSSPNIAKPFSIGHLRSTIIGDAIANTLAFSGFDVVRDNHLGDWGTQFGKLTYAIKEWGDINEIEKSDKKIKDLVALYVKFHDEAEKDKSLEDKGREFLLRLENDDKEIKDLWQKCIEWSKIEFDRIYKRLDVTFDTELGESFFEDKMPSVIEELTKKGIARESEGALAVFFDDEKYPPLLVRRSDGATLYATRDLASDKYRKDTYGDDVIILNEVGSEQMLHFRQLFETEKMLGWFSLGQRVHIAHGMYRFKDGKMSTRKGNVIWLDDIIDQAVNKAKEVTSAGNDKYDEKEKNEIAEKVAIGAIKFNDLKRESTKDIVFDWDEIMNLKGDTGPYIQYTLARIKAIEKKAIEEGIEISENIDEKNDLVKILTRFPYYVEFSAKQYEVNHIATYLLNLASSFNSYYGENIIVDKDNKIKSSERLALAKAVSVVLQNGMNLLGVPIIDRM